MSGNKLERIKSLQEITWVQLTHDRDRVNPWAVLVGLIFILILSISPGFVFPSFSCWMVNGIYLKWLNGRTVYSIENSQLTREMSLIIKLVRGSDKAYRAPQCTGVDLSVGQRWHVLAHVPVPENVNKSPQLSAVCEKNDSQKDSLYVYSLSSNGGSSHKLREVLASTSVLQ